MVGNIVIDNSVLMALVASDEDSSYAERVLKSTLTGAKLFAPALCMYEFGNAVLMGERRKRLAFGEAWTAHEKLEELPIEFRRGLSFKELSATHALALNSGLSFYDAAYLMLAMMKDARLATLDRALALAAKKQGVTVFN